MSQSGRSGHSLQVCKPPNSLLTARAAHILGRLQTTAKSRPFRLSENEASIILPKLDTFRPSWFPAWHPRYRTCNRWSDAARPAVVTAVHGISLVDNRFPVRHSWYRTGDRRRGAAGAALGAAGEGGGGRRHDSKLQRPKSIYVTSPDVHDRAVRINIVSPLQRPLDASMTTSLYWLFLR